MSDLYIGVDGGGTNTRALVIDAKGKVIGHGRAGSSNRNHYSDDEVAEALEKAMQEALGGDLRSVRGLMLGMGGVSTDADRAAIERVVRTIPGLPGDLPVRVDNDTLTGLVGGLASQPGVVLIAGTGSAAFGRNQQGQTSLCGGWGALADDRGSAYGLSLEALQAAVRMEDGRMPTSPLRQTVFEFLEIADDPRRLVDRVHNSGFERSDLARLAPKVLEAVRAGDLVAQKLMESSVSALVELVKTVARGLFPNNERFGIVLVGGLALSGEPFQPCLETELSMACPNGTVVDPILTPEAGAALEALRLGGVQVTESVVAKLREGLG